MNAKELHETFLAACDECPQFEGFDDDQEEMVNGRSINVANLYRKGIVAVVNYWRDPNTKGGSIIHDSGYSEALPKEVVTFMNNIDKIVNDAIRKALEQA